MNREKVMKNEKLVTPQEELRYLKINAYAMCGLGLGLLGFLIGGWTMIIGSLIMGGLFIWSMWTIPSWSYVFWNGECRDEYYNFIYAKACKYTLTAVFVSLGFLFSFSPGEEQMSGNTMVVIIAILTSFSHGISILMMLRGDDNE